MSEDRYERWILKEILETGFREELWNEALRQSQEDPNQARLAYIELRRRQLIEEQVEIPDLDAPVTSKVPKRVPPPDFFEEHPRLVRVIGFFIAGGIIMLGIKLMMLRSTLR